MGNRLSKISTKTGDGGETGLGDGSRVSKHSLRVQALGDVDELNSWIGLLRAELSNRDELQPLLSQVQHDLFDLGGELAIPGYQLLNEQLLLDIEYALVEHNEALPPLKDFILPGGNRAAAHCHMARAVARRSERTMVALMQEETLTDLGLRYLNRLSDLLFVLARVLARRNDDQEVLWQSRHQRED